MDFVFALVHRRDALRDRLVADPQYPDTAGYYLLVRDRRDGGEAEYWKPAELRAYLERVVASCIDVEFNAYQELPDIDEAPLLRWFRREGGAYRDLIHTLTQLKRRGWVLSNRCNPSTKRLLAVEVKEIRGNEAIVRTTEYWYLRWWSSIEQKYRYPYRETNRHTYILVKTSGDLALSTKFSFLQYIARGALGGRKCAFDRLPGSATDWSGVRRKFRGLEKGIATFSDTAVENVHLCQATTAVATKECAASMSGLSIVPPRMYPGKPLSTPALGDQRVLCLLIAEIGLFFGSRLRFVRVL